MFDAANTSFEDICLVSGRLYLESSLQSLQHQRHFDNIIERFKAESEQLMEEVRGHRATIEKLEATIRELEADGQS